MAEGKQPDFKGKLDVAAWIKKDKNGKSYLSINISTHVNLFKNEPNKIKKIEEELLI